MSPAARGPRTTDDWVERVRSASDIVEIISQTVSLKKVGRNFVGLCPFHGEKTPSFSVQPERQFYHCFSCKVGGDVFRFVQETEKVGFVEAVELLSRRANIPVPERRGTGSGGQRGAVIDALEAATEAYEQWLADGTAGAAVRSYLEGRGIDRETQRAFRLGVAPAGWEHLTRRLAGRFPDEVLVQAGLAGRRDSNRGGLFDRFRNRLIVPLIQAGGDVLGFGARALAPGDEPKYLNSPETSVYHKGSFLFALEQARRHIEPAGEVIVVEGYFDAIALHQAGLRHTVATSGTALTPEHVKILKRMTGRVALTYDGDTAGRDAVARSLGVLLAEGIDVVVVDLPAGEDPDTLVRRGGIEAWNAVRRLASDPVEFFERHVLRGKVTGDPREAAVQAVVRLIGRVPDPVRARLLIERAGAVFGLEPEVISRAVALQRGGQVSERPIQAAVHAQRRLQRGVEVDVLHALLQDRGSFEETEGHVGPLDFRDPLCAEVARWLWSGGIGFPEGADAAALVRELSLASEADYHWREQARGGVRQLVIRRLKDERKQTQERLRRAATATEQTQLLENVRDLSRNIEALERSSQDQKVAEVSGQEPRPDFGQSES